MTPPSALVLRVARGATSGALATVPMSALMLVAGRLGLMGEQPPEAITERVASLVDTSPDGATADALASLGHLAFGVASGAVYALLPRPSHVPPAVSGAGFGAAVWAASYRGWVPALGALPDADRDRKDRVAVMVVAHLVFGTALGELQSRRGR